MKTFTSLHLLGILLLLLGTNDCGGEEWKCSTYRKVYEANDPLLRNKENLNSAIANCKNSEDANGKRDPDCKHETCRDPNGGYTGGDMHKYSVKGADVCVVNFLPNFGRRVQVTTRCGVISDLGGENTDCQLIDLPSDIEYGVKSRFRCKWRLHLTDLNLEKFLKDNDLWDEPQKCNNKGSSNSTHSAGRSVHAHGSSMNLVTFIVVTSAAVGLIFSTY